MQIERRASDQDVQPQADDANRLAFAALTDGRKTDLEGIDDGHAAAALDLDGFIRSDEGGRILIEPNADRKRIVGQRGDEPSQAVSLAKMLIDDEAVGQAQAWSEPHAARDDRGTLVAEGNHVLAQYARAGARAADGHAMGIAYPNELGHRRSAQQRREPQWIAPREEDAAR